MHACVPKMMQDKGMEQEQAVADVLAAHVGALGGVSFRLVSNLEAFVQVKYIVLFDGNQNLGVFHANAGILFTF